MNTLAYELKVLSQELTAGSRTYRTDIRREGRKISRLSSLEHQSDKTFNIIGSCVARQAYMSGCRDTLKKTARNVHLARMFLKSTPYCQVESSVKESNEPNPEKISTVLSLYGEYVSTDQIKEWIEA